MQCEIRALSDRRESGRKRVSDTLPKPGRVNEVCKEWLVHEDGALAYQLQQKEVQEHYSGNRSRNAIVREDFPKALDEQKREEEEAMTRYLEMTRLQEERDARLAKDFAQRITLEEEEMQRRRLTEDEVIASQIQEKELQRTKEAKVRHNLLAAAGGSSTQTSAAAASSAAAAAAAAALGDVNSVGLPLPLPARSPSAHAHKTHQHHHHQHHLQQLAKQFRATNVDETDVPELNDLDFQEEMMRQMQEKKDEELAKMLQEQEEELDSLGMLDRDRQLAIEAQDKELAKLLQDRERAKAKRARERAKQRALLKKQQQQEMNGDSGAAESSSNSIASRPTNLDVIRINKPKMPDPEDIEVVSSVCMAGGGGGGVISGSTLPHNIAMAIDPTYTPTATPSNASVCSGAPSTTISSPSYSLPSPDFEEDDDSPVPPYMPIQGQRRTSSLEKKQKKNKKDGCKQQ